MPEGCDPTGKGCVALATAQRIMTEVLTSSILTVDKEQSAKLERQMEKRDGAMVLFVEKVETGLLEFKKEVEKGFAERDKKIDAVLDKHGNRLWWILGVLLVAALATVARFVVLVSAG